MGGRGLRALPRVTLRHLWPQMAPGWRWGVWPRTTVGTSLGRHVELVGAQN